MYFDEAWLREKAAKVVLLEISKGFLERMIQREASNMEM